MDMPEGSHEVGVPQTPVPTPTLGDVVSSGLAALRRLMGCFDTMALMGCFDAMPDAQEIVLVLATRDSPAVPFVSFAPFDPEDVSEAVATWCPSDVLCVAFGSDIQFVDALRRPLDCGHKPVGIAGTATEYGIFCPRCVLQKESAS